MPFWSSVSGTKAKGSSFTGTKRKELIRSEQYTVIYTGIYSYTNTYLWWQNYFRRSDWRKYWERTILHSRTSGKKSARIWGGVRTLFEMQKTKEVLRVYYYWFVIFSDFRRVSTSWHHFDRLEVVTGSATTLTRRTRLANHVQTPREWSFNLAWQGELMHSQERGKPGDKLAT